MATSVPIPSRAAAGHSLGRAGVVDVMNRKGFTGLNAFLVHHGGTGIAAVLRVVAAATPPVALLCTVGNDCTGLVVAAVLAVCGATDVEIVADYAASERLYARGEGAGGAAGRAWYGGRLAEVGLGAAERARVSSEVMVWTQEMMRARAGTVEAYLEKSGTKGAAPAGRWAGGDAFVCFIWFLLSLVLFNRATKRSLSRLPALPHRAARWLAGWAAGIGCLTFFPPSALLLSGPVHPRQLCLERCNSSDWHHLPHRGPTKSQPLLLLVC